MKTGLQPRLIVRELSAHAPFTALGALSGLALMAVLVVLQTPADVSGLLFRTAHPLHVFFSALVTTAMLRRHRECGLWQTLLIGILGSIGIGTLSDCLIPYLGEWLLDLPNRGWHIGFIEHWWVVNPLALLGIVIGIRRPRTRLPHLLHVLISTWASLFHILMAMSGAPGWPVFLLIGVFLFLAVWLPCCASDIVFPLLFCKEYPAGGCACAAAKPAGAQAGDRAAHRDGTC